MVKNMTIPEVIARIEAERKKAGLSQVAAAKAAGVNQGFWSHVVKGTRGVQLDTLKRMAEAVGLEVRITVKRKR